MAGAGGMNFGNAFSGIPQNMGATQQGGTLQSLPGVGTSTAQQTQQSVAQTPLNLGYQPSQNVYGYNMGRLASMMDPSATIPQYQSSYNSNQPIFPAPNYYGANQQQNINPYQGVTDILGSLGSFFNESIAPTFQSAYDQQFQNFQNQLNDMSQRFAAPPPSAPSYTSELDALRQQIAQLQGQIASPVVSAPAPTPAPAPVAAPVPAPTPAPAPSSSPLSYQAARQAARSAGISGVGGMNAQELANALNTQVLNKKGVARTPIVLTSAPTPTSAITPAPTPAPAAQNNLLNNQEPLDGMDQYMRAGGVVNKYAGGGEIPAFDSSLNSGPQSNLMSSAERVYDLGPGYRELGVVPGNIAGGTAGPNVPYVAPPGLTPPPATSTTTSATPIKYSQALSEYQKLGLGQQGIFGLATTPQQLADALKKPVIQKGKTYTPKTTGAAHGGMVHGGMTNRLKHMLK